MTELCDIVGFESICEILIENEIVTPEQFISLAASEERAKLVLMIDVTDEELDDLVSLCQNAVEHDEKIGTSQLLADMAEFTAFGTVLESQGISTVKEFLGLAISNEDGIKALLEIDDVKLQELINAAKGRLTTEENKTLEETDIKKIGEDYKLGLRVKGEEQ